MSALTEKKCSVCEGNPSRLNSDRIRALYRELNDDWEVVKEHHLEREFKFKDFREALAFTNRVGEIAERQGHHPDIYLEWGKARISLWTHSADGLTENDFILAAKIDEISAV